MPGPPPARRRAHVAGGQASISSKNQRVKVNSMAVAPSREAT